MMSQRNAVGRADALSPGLLAPGDEVEKFMSVMLTYIGFNVTRLPATAKYYIFSPDRTPNTARHIERPAEMAANSFIRAIVERHVGQHTGVRVFRQSGNRPWAGGRLQT